MIRKYSGLDVFVVDDHLQLRLHRRVWDQDAVLEEKPGVSNGSPGTHQSLGGLAAEVLAAVGRDYVGGERQGVKSTPNLFCF